jgi:sugar phosphate isomerase/epimerase
MSQEVQLGVQLYSLRNDLGPNLEATFHRLKKIGFTHVEPHEVLEYTAELKAGLQASGLRADTAHAKVTTPDRDDMVAAAEELGIGTLVIPWADPTYYEDRAGVAELARQINEAARYAADHGIRIGYHNHEFEFEKKIDGRAAYEVMVESLDDNVVLELDTYWASVGGADVFELLPRLSNRVRFLHINNEPPEEDDPPTLGVSIIGRVDEVVALGRDFVELNVLEIVVEEDVFPFLEANFEYFSAGLSA